ncbi:MAG: cupredoxin domain-containing protein [Deltaproteobacteria bacterium]
MKYKSIAAIIISASALVLSSGAVSYGCDTASKASAEEGVKTQSVKTDAPPTQTASNKSEPVSVDIKLFTFKPGVIEIPEGATITWTNGDAIEHSVTNGTPEKTGDAFDSDYFTKGQTYSFTFAKAGEYPYFCKRHTNMVGSVKVVPAAPGHSGHSY